MLAERFTPLRAALALVLGLAGGAAGAGTGVSAAPAVGDDGLVHLTVVVPLVVPASAEGFIPIDALEQYTQPQGLLSRQLDAVINRPVTIAIDPRIIASIRILGSDAPASATAWLDRLSAAGNETFALTYADTDITLATQAGQNRVPTPASFDFAIDPARFAAAVEGSPAPTPAPGSPGLPTSESLVAWNYSIESIAWPRGGTVNSSDLSVIAASGFESVLLSSANAKVPGRAVLAGVGGSTAVVEDDAVSSAVRAAAASTTPESLQSALAALQTELDSAPGTVVATLDRQVPVSGTQLAATIDALEANPVVRLTALSRVLGQSPVLGELVESSHDATRVEATRRLFEAEDSELKFATIAERPGDITDPRRLQLLALLSTTWTGNLAGWTAAVDDFLLESTELLNSVQVVESSAINLLADSASLPISVSNSLAQTVTVYITVLPRAPLIAVIDSEVELVIEPNSQAKGQVPVQSISNGTVVVATSLTSAAGVEIGSRTLTEINVQAGWETPIVVVLAAIVVVVFAVGIVRNILRRRRSAAEVAEATE